MPITTCDSSEALRAEIEIVRRKVSLDETEETWDTVAQGIQHLTRLCNIGGCEFPVELVAGIRSVSRPLNSALSSERSRLSGAAVELVTALATGLGSLFDPLVPQFVPTLLVLCGRTNKHTRLPSLLPYLAELSNHKSIFPRLTAAEGILACLNCCNPPDLEKETRARVVEDFIKLTARDASADVRKASKEVFKAYRTLMPARVDNFVAPLTPVVKKYLDIQTGTSSNAGQRQTSRPASRANNKVMEPCQRPASSALPEPPTRPTAVDPARSTRQQPVAHGLPTAATTHAPRQRTTSQIRRDLPQPRNLHITALSSSAPQRCIAPPPAPVRPAIQRPPSAAARILPAPNATSSRGPQRPPPVQMRLNPPSDRLKVTGNGAKRIPLPPVPVQEHTNEAVVAITDTGNRAGNTVDKFPSKLPGRSADATAVAKLAVGRKVPEGARSAASSTRPNRSAPVQRSHQRPTKGEMNNPNGVAPLRRPPKSTRPQVKTEKKATSPTLIPLPPSPSTSPTEIPLPPSPDCAPHLAKLETQDEVVTMTPSATTEIVGKQSKPAERCQELSAPSTPITTLLSSIQRGFLFTPSTPLSPPQNYLPVCGNFSEKIANTVIASDASKGLLAGAPFCTSLDDDSAGDGSDRHALRDLN